MSPGRLRCQACCREHPMAEKAMHWRSGAAAAFCYLPFSRPKAEGQQRVDSCRSGWGRFRSQQKTIPKQPHECRGRFVRTRIRTDPQRPPVALAAQGRDRAGQWTWHRAPRHPHDPAVLGPADVVGIPQRPPILLRRRHRFIQRWGWRGDQGARSKTSTSAALPFARVTPVSSESRAASPVSRVRPLTSTVPRTT